MHRLPHEAKAERSGPNAEGGTKSAHTDHAYLAAYSAAQHAALRVLGDGDDAADAASEAFVRFWHTNRRSPEEVQNLVGYLRVAGRWQALMTLRQRRSLESLQARMLAVPADAPGATEPELERHGLRAYVDRLPAQCSRVMTARLVNGLTPAQTAASLGMSPKAVEKQVTRGVRLLRELLGGSRAESARCRVAMI
jgi:RNA polymerase sigma factor (sigma-70 family)